MLAFPHFTHSPHFLSLFPRLFFYFLLFTSLLPVCASWWKFCYTFWFLTFRWMRPKPPQNNENWFCYFAYFSAVTPPHLSPHPPFVCPTLCLRRTACWLSLWLPPLWSSAMERGKEKETEGFWQKTLAFYCPCYCCCIYLAAVKAVEECTFLRLSRFCVLPSPQPPSCPEPTPSWHPLRGIRVRLSFYSCLSWWCWVLSHKI